MNSEFNRLVNPTAGSRSSSKKRKRVACEFEAMTATQQDDVAQQVDEGAAAALDDAASAACDARASRGRRPRIADLPPIWSSALLRVDAAMWRAEDLEMLLHSSAAMVTAAAHATHAAHDERPLRTLQDALRVLIDDTNVVATERHEEWWCWM